MLYSHAKQLADELIEVMKPYCLKIEIAGSVRRKKEQVHDIEICLVPENANKLFNVLGKFLLQQNKNFKYTKNGSRYKQFVYKDSQVDLFIAKPDNWGIIFLVRTGSAAFSTKMLAAWKKVSEGGYSKDGYLYDKNDKIIYTYEENDVFRLCKMDFVEPEDRSVDFP
jgi:DNA polymerase/3'-5' exonuclease PolX